VRFPLDPLWAHPAIDAVGIDFYPPISDWREGLDHADLDLGRSVYDWDYCTDAFAGFTVGLRRASLGHGPDLVRDPHGR